MLPKIKIKADPFLICLANIIKPYCALLRLKSPSAIQHRPRPDKFTVALNACVQAQKLARLNLVK